MTKNINFWKTLGPGLMWAGAAIGVSHLVQSTRAGAMYGFGFVGVLLLANLFKYPAFEFAPRYTAATGKNLLHGYKQLGKWAPILFVVLTLSTMFTIQAVVTLVTAGIANFLFGSMVSIPMMSFILLLVSAVVLFIGNFGLVDKLMKVIILTLSVTTLMAVFIVLGKGYHPNLMLVHDFSWSNHLDVLFLIAFVGWMPSAIDISVWHSIWSIEKQQVTLYKPTVKEALLDFNIGYIGTVFFGFCFILLGAYVMYGTGMQFSADGVTFSGQLVELYTSSIGQWAYWIIGIAAFTTMFSTTLTCLDAFPRVLKETTLMLLNKPATGDNKGVLWFWVAVLVAGSLVIITLTGKNTMTTLVDLATTLSFVTAPLLAYLNHRAITHSSVPKEAQPKPWLLLLSWTGMGAMILFSFYFLYIKFFS